MSEPFDNFVDAFPGWAITKGTMIAYTSVRKTRSEAWWAVQQTSGHSKSVLQKQGFKAERILLVREERKA